METTCPDHKAASREFGLQLLCAWDLGKMVIALDSVRKDKKRRIVDPHDGFNEHSYQVDVNSLTSLSLLLPPLKSRDAVWNLNTNQFELIVDNSPLAAMLNGQAFYSGYANFDVMTANINLINSIFEKGWTPRCTVLPVAVWQPRVSNTLADYLANYAIEKKTDFLNTSPLFACALCSPNYFIQCRSDGAFRSRSNEAASAYVITAIQEKVGGSPDCFVLEAQAAYIRNGTSAFNSEASAVYSLLYRIHSSLP
jgi:hypothetical protein